MQNHSEEFTLKVYKLIQMNIFNSKSKNGLIAEEIFCRFFIEKEDLVQDLMLLFIEKIRKKKIKQETIKNLKGFVSTFTTHALLDIKKKELRQKRIERKYLEKYKEDEWKRNKVFRVKTLIIIF